MSTKIEKHDASLIALDPIEGTTIPRALGKDLKVKMVTRQLFWISNL